MDLLRNPLRLVIAALLLSGFSFIGNALFPYLIGWEKMGLVAIFALTAYILLTEPLFNDVDPE